MTRSLPHRGPQGWRKWCCAATKRFCMRSSATVPLSRCSGPTLLSWRQCDSFIFHMCTARYSQASTTGQHDDDCGAETIWHRQSRPSYWARPAKQRGRHRSAARLREGHGCDVPRLDATVRSRLGSTCTVSRWSCRVAAPCRRHSAGCWQCRRRLSRVLAARERGEKVLPNSRDTETKMNVLPRRRPS